MVIAIGPDNYVVRVKETDHSTFKHRIPFEAVNTIGIKGDASITLVNFMKVSTILFINGLVVSASIIDRHVGFVCVLYIRTGVKVKRECRGL